MPPRNGPFVLARRTHEPGPSLTRRQEPRPGASAASAPSALSGFDFDVCFPPRLRVSAVNIVLPRRSASLGPKLARRPEPEAPAQCCIVFPKARILSKLCGADPLVRAGRPRPAISVHAGACEIEEGRPGGRPADVGVRPTAGARGGNGKTMRLWASTASATSALSGVDVDVSFPRRLRVSAVNDVFYPSAPQNTEASKRPTIVIHPLNSLTGTEV